MSDKGGKSVNDPSARKARQAIRDGVRRGCITKPSYCPVCGMSMEPGNLSGHHPRDYDGDNKKRVRWMCHKCHSAANKAHPVQRHR